MEHVNLHDLDNRFSHALYVSVLTYNINIMVFQFRDGSDHIGFRPDFACL